MTQEDKELLLKDLCARIPYGVMVCEDYYEHKRTLPILDCGVFFIIDHIDKVKPYLRPMSSMTEEEFKELAVVTELQYDQLEVMDWGNDKTLEFYLSEVPQYCVIKVFDWLNKKHLDYRGLIPMGLAMEAPEGMYGKMTCNNCPDKDFCSQSQYIIANCHKLK